MLTPFIVTGQPFAAQHAANSVILALERLTLGSPRR
jgi:hypothetical protein